MIFLKSIYSEPSGLFTQVNFFNGINVIYGRYSGTSKNKSSLNSIGKSTLVSLIDFCLLSSYSKNSPLKKASTLTDNYYIVLEIEVNNNLYLIKRTTKKNRKVLFGEKGTDLREYDLKDLNKIFLEDFFNINKNSKVDVTFRQLIKFFIREEKSGYSDEITYMKGPAKADIISYNLFLLGIDSSLADKSYLLRKDIKHKKELRKEVKKVLQKNFDIGNIEELNSKMYFLNNNIKQLEEQLKQYELNASYENAQESANKITEELKLLVIQNQKDKYKVNQYKSILNDNVDIPVNDIVALYNNLKQELGSIVKKSLEDAINFREYLINSRKEFLDGTLKNLENKIEERKEKIIKLDDERSKLFKFLDEIGAIKDLTESFESLNNQKEKLMELNGKLKFYNDLGSKIVKLETKEAENNLKVNEFITSITTTIDNLRQIFLTIYSELYNDKEKGLFNISYNSNNQSDYRFLINAQTNDSSGWGKGRGCILTYDLMVLFNGLQNHEKFPGFIIHDGIFNGVDTSQWISLMNYLYRLEKDKKFQYIFTINEPETEISEDTEKKIGFLNFELKEKIIAEYSDNKKIFGTDLQ
jgi:uncharacterized protein YydD (DUF2326 family)